MAGASRWPGTGVVRSPGGAGSRRGLGVRCARGPGGPSPDSPSLRPSARSAPELRGRRPGDRGGLLPRRRRIRHAAGAGSRPRGPGRAVPGGGRTLSVEPRPCGSTKGCARARCPAGDALLVRRWGRRGVGTPAADPPLVSRPDVLVAGPLTEDAAHGELWSGLDASSRHLRGRWNGPSWAGITHGLRRASCRERHAFGGMCLPGDRRPCSKACAQALIGGDVAPRPPPAGTDSNRP